MKRFLVAVVLLAACKTPVVRTDVTGVTLTVSFAATIDQLTVVGRHANGEVVGTHTVRAGASPQKVAIVLNTPIADERLRLRVDGLSGGVVVASGAGSVTIAVATMAEVTIELGAAAVCGDGTVQTPLEACDDGALVKGDGCDDECVLEPARCGDGLKAASEACDDGNSTASDGCTACVIDAGYECSGKVCTRLCGNGQLDGGEECDDDDNDDLDGCSASCTREPGFTCSGEPSTCALTCGDGDVDVGEQCDDDGLATGDGCDDFCQRENGWECDSASPSDCHFSCGDGTIDSGETCDDTNLASSDGCNSACARENGWECVGAGVGSCHFSCGDGTIDLGETCDDVNAVNSDGCTACVRDTGWECVGAGVGSCHFSCGDSTLDVGEACDDGDAGGDGCDASCAIEVGWECDTLVEPSTCNPKCGNGCVDAGETCDFGAPVGSCGARPDALAGETCLSRGSRRGGGPGLACDGACGAFVVTGCTGGLIDTPAQIQAAIADAYATGTHQTIAIHGGVYNIVTNPIALDECPSGCAAPTGVTLAPLGVSGATGVTFMPDAVTPSGVLFRIGSGRNVLRGFSFVNASNAIVLDDSTNTLGENVITQNRFVHTDATVGKKFVTADSTGNRIIANEFRNDGALMDWAVQLAGADNVVAMNLMRGSYGGAGQRGAVSVVASAGDLVMLDHNSMMISGFGVHIQSAVVLLARNNIIVGDGVSTAWRLNAAPTGPVGPTSTQANIIYNHGTDCQTCTCPGPLCTSLANPQLDAVTLCLTNPGSPAINAGVDVAYDLLDGNPLLFTPAAPEIGARETGSTRSYGGVSSSCP